MTNVTTLWSKGEDTNSDHGYHLHKWTTVCGEEER
jgi:hypothetical protein